MLTFARTFCPDNVDPCDSVDWTRSDVTITKADSSAAFRQSGVWHPTTWSPTAVKVVASKYFSGHLGAADREDSVYKLIARVTDAIGDWLHADGYTDPDSAYAASADLAWLCLHQHLAFNSPVWFNVGVKPDPQTSACFILSLEDKMNGPASITDVVATAARLFKDGSGVGFSVAALRGDGEPLSDGGTASGPVSFMRLFDAVGGVIKSGGRTRRAATMITIDAAHPDVLGFIDCKADAEKKAHALIDAGYDGAFNAPGGAYDSILFQNANHSVRVTDAFMSAVDSDGDWTTTYRTTGKPAATVKARSILTAIAEAAWACGDPGMQFDTTINGWHTCPNTDRIHASNPCQPAFATVLTPDGIRTFADIDVGSTIWSGARWTRVTAKWSTGIKPVHRYQTTAGAFIGTENHRVVSRGEKHEVGTVDAIDTVTGPTAPHAGVEKPQAIMDGLVMGDGSARLVNGGASRYMILHIGGGDKSYFDSEVADLIGNKFDGEAHRVTTTITAEELPVTYRRRVPARYLTADRFTVAAFLRGLYSANGSICGGRVTLKAASFGVIADVQQMLSVIGIRSYYTTNPAHRVTFANGEYDCRESYDLNITTDRDKFADMIGFIQPDKIRRLNEALQITKAARGPKVTYDIVSIDHLGDHEVFDITVEAEEHTYWTGGMLVSNCSEYMFLNDSACNLASLNLLKFLNPDNTFDVDRFTAAVRLAITAMDALIDRSSYPTDRIAENSRNFRPLGLGYANLGALLMTLGLPYDSDEARHLAAAITSLMSATAYHQSALLAQSRGPFAGFADNAGPMMSVVERHADETNKLLQSTDEEQDCTRIAIVAAGMWDRALQLGRAHGYRNGQVTVLAPTGTIGFMMDCDTTGIEPDFALVKHKALVGGGTIRTVNQSVPRALQSLGYTPATAAHILRHLEQTSDIASAPDLRPDHHAVFACANDIAPSGHLRMMAAVQPFLSGAISKTVNLPNSATPSDIFEVYRDAHKLGLKAVAVYRDGCKRSQPLTTAPTTSTPAPAQSAPTRRRLPDTRQSITHRAEFGGLELYLTAGRYLDGAPGELFVTSNKSGSMVRGLLDAVGILISLLLQYGVPLGVITRKLEGQSFGAAGFTGEAAIPYARSVVDYIARWLSAITGAESSPAPAIPDTAAEDSDAPPCGHCGTTTVRAGTCYLCPNCGTTTGCG